MITVIINNTPNRVSEEFLDFLVESKNFKVTTCHEFESLNIRSVLKNMRLTTFDRNLFSTGYHLVKEEDLDLFFVELDFYIFEMYDDLFNIISLNKNNIYIDVSPEQWEKSDTRLKKLLQTTHHEIKIVESDVAESYIEFYERKESFKALSSDDPDKIIPKLIRYPFNRS